MEDLTKQRAKPSMPSMAVPHPMRSHPIKDDSTGPIGPSPPGPSGPLTRAKVRPGHTVHLADPNGEKVFWKHNADGKEVYRPLFKACGPGTVIELPQSEVETMLRDGFVELLDEPKRKKGPVLRQDDPRLNQPRPMEQDTGIPNDPRLDPRYPQNR
jgi:hypothetical protein